MVMQEETVHRTAAPDSVAALSITGDAFIGADQDEGGLAEWINGRVIVHDVPKEAHQRIAGLLFFLLLAFVSRRRLGRVIIAPYKMRPTTASPVREPDVLYIAADHLGRLTESLLDGPADMAIEVVSDDSAARDRSDKFDEYQDGGVLEYWVIDSRQGRERADFWVLAADGRYRPIPVADDGTYRSTVLPGFQLRLDWLWQEDPDVWAMLGEVLASNVGPEPSGPGHGGS